MLKSVDEVVEHLVSPINGKWTQDNGQDIHLIMTGGEPLLAWQRLYIELFEHPKMKDLKNTHLKQTLHNFYMKILETIPTSKTRFEVTWSCSKFSVSGDLGILLT